MYPYLKIRFHRVNWHEDNFDSNAFVLLQNIIVYYMDWECSSKEMFHIILAFINSQFAVYSLLSFFHIRLLFFNRKNGEMWQIYWLKREKKTLMKAIPETKKMLHLLLCCCCYNFKLWFIPNFGCHILYQQRSWQRKSSFAFA